MNTLNNEQLSKVVGAGGKFKYTYTKGNHSFSVEIEVN